MRDKAKAFLIHALFSLVFVGAFAALVRWGWYAGPVFWIQGAGTILLLLVVVDVIIGPLLTGVVYKRGKRTLKMDIGVIVVIQIVALAYGAFHLVSQRPVYFAHVGQRVDIVRAADIDFEEVPEHLRQRWSWRPRLVYVDKPEDDPEQMESIVRRSEQTGFGFAFEPSLYKPFPGPLWELRTFGRDIDQVTRDPVAQRKFAHWFDGQEVGKDEVLLYPLVGRLTNASILFHRSDGRLLGMIDYDPMPIPRL